MTLVLGLKKAENRTHSSSYASKVSLMQADDEWEEVQRKVSLEHDPQQLVELARKKCELLEKRLTRLLDRKSEKDDPAAQFWPSTMPHFDAVAEFT